MNKIPLEVGKAYVVDLSKEASVKVKRYLIEDVVDSYPRFWKGDEKLVLAEHYDALLALARRLRRSWLIWKSSAEESELYRDSAWLEE